MQVPIERVLLNGSVLKDTRKIKSDNASDQNALAGVQDPTAWVEHAGVTAKKTASRAAPVTGVWMFMILS